MPTLTALLDDPANDVALAAFCVLCEFGDERTDLAAVYGKLAEREGLKFDDDLHTAFNRTRAGIALCLIGWPSTASAAPCAR